jgi:hypothetical protein
MYSQLSKISSEIQYKFLILDTCHSYTTYLREQGREDPWLFFEAERGPPAKQLGKHSFNRLLHNIALTDIDIFIAHFISLSIYGTTVSTDNKLSDR